MIFTVIVIAVVVFFVAKKLKGKSSVEVKVTAKPAKPAKPAASKAPAKKKTKTVKPAGGASLSESDSNGDYYRKPRKAQK